MSKKLIFALIVVSFAGVSLGYASSKSLVAGYPKTQQLLQAALSAAEKKFPDSQTASVSEISGKVYVQKKGTGGFKKIAAASTLEQGDTLKTASGRCRIAFENGTEMTIGPNSSLAINESLKNTRQDIHSTLLYMKKGMLQAHIKNLTAGSRFEISTPTAVASVRGTVLYLDASQQNGQPHTEIFVDETQKGVFFYNPESGDGFLVGDNNASSASGDGTVAQPQELNEQQQQEFVNEWNQNLNSDSGGSGESGDSDQNETQTQSGSSGESTASDPDNPDSDLDEGLNDTTNDAAIDQFSEQNSGSDVANDTAGDMAAQLAEEAERLQIREEISRLLVEQNFAQLDAQFEQIRDAQTGKVFTDAHGNRVRVDQYIFKPTPSEVQVMSLTLRTGSYQNGVSSILFGTRFNRDLTAADGLLRDLPWDDYLNVVTKEEMQSRLRNPTDPSVLYPQYVVHEDSSRINAPNPLFPVNFYTEFSNPTAGRAGTDKLRFEEIYSNPFDVDIYGNNQVIVRVKAQGRTSERALISPFGRPNIELITTRVPGGPYGFTEQQELKIGGTPIQNFATNNGNQCTSGCDDHHRQSAGFANYFNANRQSLMSADGINSLENHPLNNDSDLTNDIAPASFEDKISIYSDSTRQVVTENHVLMGLFLPITDDGRVINAPGFELHGIRDLLNPHPLVNGGNYNLEALLMYGHFERDPALNKDIFVETFRVDAIITPEIFTGTSVTPQENSSRLFPATLNDQQPA